MRLVFLILLLALVAGCQGQATEPPPDPLPLVTEAAENIRQTETFRMLVEQTGAPYYIETDLGNVIFRRAEAQYVAPDQMQAAVRLIATGLPADVDVFSEGEDQWYRNSILTANRWVNAPFSPGFNPQSLIAEESGFQQSLQAMIDLNYVGETTLETGAPVFHLEATARGEDVTALMAGLVSMTGTVNVEVYINRETILPERFVIEQPETVTEDEPEPTTWTIDIYDVNAAPEIEDPTAERAESTAAPLEATVTPLSAATAQAGA